MREETKIMLADACRQLDTLVAFIQSDTDIAVSQDEHVSLIRHYDAVRIGMEQVKQARKSLEAIEEKLNRELVPDVMRRAGVKTITVDGVGRVTIANRISASIITEMKVPAFDWLRSTGQGGLIAETVNSQSLGGFARTYIEEEGRELPEDLFKTSFMSYTSITKR